MSIEKALADLTTAVVALTEITTRLHDLRVTTVDEIKNVAASTKAPAKAKAAEKPAADTASDTKPAADAPADGAKHRLADVQAACATYAGGTDREDERTARKEKLAWLFKKVGATKLGDIPEGKEGAVLKAVNQLIEAGDLTEAPSDETDGDGSGDDDLLAT